MLSTSWITNQETTIKHFLKFFSAFCTNSICRRHSFTISFDSSFYQYQNICMNSISPNTRAVQQSAIQFYCYIMFSFDQIYTNFMTYTMLNNTFVDKMKMIKIDNNPSRSQNLTKKKPPCSSRFLFIMQAWIRFVMEPTH